MVLDTITKITLGIAIYGAVLSTAALLWKIYNNLQDKPKIKVTAEFGFLDFGKKPSETQLIITAVNKGKRSVYLSSVGLRSGKENLIKLHPVGLPCKLEGGGSHSEWFEAEKLKDRKFNFAWYRDATGKLHRSKDISKKLETYFRSEKGKDKNA